MGRLPSHNETRENGTPRAPRLGWLWVWPFSPVSSWARSNLPWDWHEVKPTGPISQPGNRAIAAQFIIAGVVLPEVGWYIRPKRGGALLPKIAGTSLPKRGGASLPKIAGTLAGEN